MGCFYTPGMPYDVNAFLDNLGAYSVSEAAFDALELARQITESQKYYFLGVPFPGVSDIQIAARETFTGNVTVPPLSIIVALTGGSYYAELGPAEEAIGTIAKEGFQFRIYDKGAKMDTFLITSYGNNYPSLGNMANLANPDNTSNQPVGPFFPPSPLVILEPGSLQLSITNLAEVSCFIQIMMQLAVPVNRLSSNEIIGKTIGNRG